MSSFPSSGDAYFVLDPAGNRYGPADLVQLNQWAAEGRVVRTTVLEHATTGQQVVAGTLPGLVIPDMGAAPMNTADYSRPPSMEAAYARAPIPENIPNNLSKAIFATVCCCIPLGIVAIVNAAKVDGLVARGEYGLARDASRKADQIANWSIIIGLIIGVLQIIRQLNDPSSPF